MLDAATTGSVTLAATLSPVDFATTAAAATPAAGPAAAAGVPDDDVLAAAPAEPLGAAERDDEPDEPLRRARLRVLLSPTAAVCPARNGPREMP